jgi:ankyrin repeat protein
MQQRITLQELIREAGVVPDSVRQPCLPAPIEHAVTASAEDHAQARSILLDRRAKNPDHKDVLKRIFRSSKDKEKAQDVTQFSQEELDHALSAALGGSATSPGLTQAFLGLGAKVNFIETPDKKKGKGNQPNTSLRRRSTVLQQAASSRRPTQVGLLASAGADQTTLDESLKAALTTNDQACVRELLRHGADINTAPNSLSNAVRSNDQNFVQLLLRAPKPLRADVISSCLPAAVQQMSDVIVLLLIAYGADPNFDTASALNIAIGQQNYKLAISLVTGPVPLTQAPLQRLLDTTMRLPTSAAQLQFLQLLLCCGLPPNSIGLPGLLVNRVKNNDTAGASMMLSHGVSATANEAECLRAVIAKSSWGLAFVILQRPISPSQASAALAVVPLDAPQSERLRIVQALLQNGATGDPLSYWLTRAVEEGDTSLMDLLLSAGAPVASSDKNPIYAAIARKDMRSLKVLLNTRPPPEALGKAFPLLRNGYSPAERLETSRLLLQYGAHGTEVDEALVNAAADLSTTRDPALITELIQHGASVSHDNGKVLQLAALQMDLPLLRLLCNYKPTPSAASSALHLAFGPDGKRHSTTAEIFELLVSHGVIEKAALKTLQIAVNGGMENLDIIKHLVAANARLKTSTLDYIIAMNDPKRKAPVLATLLSMEVGQGALDNALVSESHHAVSNKDTTSIEILLAHGASVGYNDGEALNTAVVSRNSRLTSLLLSGKYRPSPSSITAAFRTLFASEGQPSTKVGFESLTNITKELLALGVEQASIDSALQATLSSAHHSETLVEMLLDDHANVNVADGACFVKATQHGPAVFEKLLRHKPDFSIIVPALISSKLTDIVVVASVESCFRYGCTSDQFEETSHSTKTPVLILAMQEYPRCEALIKLLLDHGCNPDVFTRYVFSSHHESLSVLYNFASTSSCKDLVRHTPGPVQTMLKGRVANTITSGI